jgi:Cu/Ag efflux pump CusA
MSRRAFDAEITLDLAVNAIPFLIIGFFVAVFALFNPWGFDPLQSTIQFAILIHTMLSLAVVTWVAARVIETDERTRHETSETPSDR